MEKLKCKQCDDGDVRERGLCDTWFRAKRAHQARQQYKAKKRQKTTDGGGSAANGGVAASCEICREECRVDFLP
eukprot:SAG11_NODE_450_length_9391_cov_16.666272_1_plen_74_part_00